MNAYNYSTSTFEKSGAKPTFPKGGAKSDSKASSEGATISVAKVSETNIFIYYDFI
jgi:hypothetical protein